MTTHIWIVGLPLPFHVKGEPDEVRAQLLKYGTYHDLTANSDTVYAAFAPFERAERRDQVFINPAHVAAVAGPT